MLSCRQAIQKIRLGRIHEAKWQSSQEAQWTFAQSGPETSALKSPERSGDARTVEDAKGEPPPADAARRARVLFVEDSYLLIVTLEDMCEEFGWEVVGPATRLAQALHLARTESLDAAFLDVNLDGEMSWEVALVLKARGVPFAFSSGYDGASVLPPALANAQILRKPFRVDEIVRCIRKMLARRSDVNAA